MVDDFIGEVFLRLTWNSRIKYRTDSRQKPEVVLSRLALLFAISSTFGLLPLLSLFKPLSLVQARRYPSSETVDDDDDEGDPLRGRDMGGSPTRQQYKWTANSMIGESLVSLGPLRSTPPGYDM